MHERKVIPLDGAEPRRAARQPHAATVVGRLREQARGQLRELVRGMFDSVDDALFDLAEKAESNAQQSAYFDAMRAVRLARAEMERRFLDAVATGFDLLLTGAPRTPAAAQEGSLSLVDEEEVEESVAIAGMVDKAEARYRGELHALRERFQALLGRRRVDPDEMPLAPRRLCEAFREASESMDVELRVRLIVLKLFDRFVVSELGTLYQEANRLLVAAGVLPDLRVRARTYPATRGRVAPTSARPGPSVELPAEVGEGTASDAALFETLLALIGRRKEGAVPAGGSYWGTTEVVGALDALQRSAEAAVEGDVKEALVEQIRRIHPASGAAAINRVDDDVIDMIGMLFDFILDDRNLPEPMKALIGRLQIPILKVAILDKGFFSQKGHPARRLLNTLAQAALGWDERADRGPGSLYAKIEETVNRVLTEFGEDVGLFETLLEDFEAYLEAEERHFALVEERIRQASEGRERLEIARARAAEAIAEAIAGRPLPPVARRLLEGPWHNVLVMIALREGEGSERWLQAVEVAQRLVWSVQPGSAADRAAYARAVAPLVGELRAGFSLVSLHEDEAQAYLAELEACHIAVLRGRPLPGTEEAAARASEEKGGQDGQAPQEPRLAVPEIPPEEETAETAPRAEALPEERLGEDGIVEEIVLAAEGAAGLPDPAARDEHVERLERVEVGTWFELPDEEGGRVRAKLSWRSPVTDRMVFVNRKGAKVAERTLHGLAAELRRGDARILEDVPLLDRAMNAAVEALKRHLTA